MTSEMAKFVYIAGPYTQGEWGTNIRNAVQAAERVWQLGHVPFIPHTETALWSILISVGSGLADATLLITHARRPLGTVVSASG